MAGIKGPLFSASAHGSVHKLLTFSKRKEGQITRKYKDNKYSPSVQQKINRFLLKIVVTYWQAMSEAEKDTWRAKAAAGGYQITGYQQFCKDAMLDNAKYLSVIGYWPFDELDGNYFNNQVGDYGHLLKEGDVTLSDSFAKKYKKCVNLTQENTGLVAQHNQALNPKLGDYHVEFWLKGPYKYPLSRVWQKSNTIGTYGCLIYIANDRLWVRFGDGVKYVSFARGPLPLDGTWHKWNINFDRSDTAKVFRNGQQQGLGVSLNQVTGNINPSFLLRVGHKTDDFNGYLEQLIVFKRSLGSAEILTRYNADIS